MAVSNTISFTVTRNDIITAAYDMLGVLGDGVPATDNQILRGSRLLNMMTKSWQADGLNLFALRKVNLFTEEGVESYTLSSTTSNHFTTVYVSTTITTSNTIGNTNIVISSTEGISIGDNISIVSNNKRVWYKVLTVDSTTNLTLTTPLTADITAGENVHSYTSLAERPMKVMEGYLHQTLSNTDLPMAKVARQRYNDLTVKSSAGLPTQFYYDPQITGATLNVWPTAQNENDIIVLFAQATLSDMQIGTNNPEYPQEWYLPLVLNLALLIAPGEGIPDDIYRKVNVQAIKWYEAARGFDTELYTSVYFANDTRGGIQ